MKACGPELRPADPKEKLDKGFSWNSSMVVLEETHGYSDFTGQLF